MLFICFVPQAPGAASRPAGMGQADYRSLLSQAGEFVMKPTEILRQEHRVIEQVLSCLERMADQCSASGALDRDSAQSAIGFFRTFADQCHHGKEETHLFPAMEAQGFSRESGPTGVMLHEHELGREHVGRMDQAIEAASAGDETAQQQFIQHARAYVHLLREHIGKEDHCLFALADQALSQVQQQRLLEAFQHVETAHMGAGTHEKYLQLADELAERYGVTQTSSPAAGHTSSCCGH